MTCPVDRQPVTTTQLKAAPRILRNLLSRLNIECDNASLGCDVIIKLDQLGSHLNECDFNPKKPVECTDCGLIIPKDELKDHNCVRDLRQVVLKQNEKISEMDVNIKNLRREMNIMKDVLQAIRNNAAASGATGLNLSSLIPSLDTYELDEVDRWVQMLPRARVTRWGGMISTPDTVLQESVRKGLIESNCPLHVVNELMENSHERRWPPGLSTLEIRQMNRRIYDNYICRKIPSRQAVVVMACDNGHISEDMLLDPGLVMIFAHGIE